MTIGYTVVAATAQAYIARWICNATGVAKGGCHDYLWMHVLIFSALQVRFRIRINVLLGGVRFGS